MKNTIRSKQIDIKSSTLVPIVFLIITFLTAMEMLFYSNNMNEYATKITSIAQTNDIPFFESDTKNTASIYDLLNNKTIEIESNQNDMALGIEAKAISFEYSINKEEPKLYENKSKEIKRQITIYLNKGDVVTLKPVSITADSQIIKASYGLSFPIKAVMTINHENKLQANSIFYSLGFILIFLYVIFRKTKIVEPQELYIGFTIIVFTFAFSVDNIAWQYFLDNTIMLYEVRNVLTSFLPFLIFKAISCFDIKYRKTNCVLSGVSVINILFQVVVNATNFEATGAFTRITGVLLSIAVMASIIVAIDKIKNKVVRKTSTIVVFIVFFAAVILMATTNMVMQIYNANGMMQIALSIAAILSMKRIILNIKEIHNKEIKHEREITDSLTSLWNKKYLDEEILNYKNNDNSEIAVIQFDINDLRKRNEKFGHEEGDAVIVKVANLIKKAFSSTGECFRQGSDEFVVIVKGDQETCMHSLDDFYNELSDINRGIHEDLKIEVAHGTAVGKASLIKKLMESAYKNMLISKQALKSNEQEDNQTYKMIKHAILHESVEPYFQPIRDNKTGSFNKFEALIRIQYNGKTYPPGFFMDYIKHSSQYFTISSQMIQKVFDAFKDIDATVSINISSQDIANPDISELIKQNLNRPHKNKIILELLETEEFNDTDKLMKFLQEVKELGAIIAIDDFGSGYANLKLISQVKPDIIKIDGEIIKNIEHDATMVSIVNSVVKIAESINADVVAEYIENENIQKIIEKNNVRYSQGYFFSKPIPIGEIQPYLK